MYQLYYSPGAASLVVHWMLIELGLPYELKKLDMSKKEHKTPEYLALNPNGVVPTLVVDGKPMFEAAALITYLADCKPSVGLAPELGSIERGKYYQWMFYLANTLQPPFRSWWYPAEAAGEANSEAAKEQARMRIESVFSILHAHLATNGPYMLGEKISAVDFMLVMLMRWSRGMPKTGLDYPHLAKLADLLRARPSWKTLYAEEGLEEWA